MRNGGNFLTIIGMVGCVLHETVDDVVPWRTESFIVDTWNGYIDKWGLADSVLFCLLISLS